MAGDHLLFKDGHLVFKDGHLVFGDAADNPCDCCEEEIPEGDDCSLCAGITPLYMDVTFSGFGCCYGGGMNATFKLPQVDPCNWLDSFVVGGATVTIRITQDLGNTLLQWNDGDDFYAWNNFGGFPTDCESITWEPQAQPPSFGPCAGCRDAVSATAVAGAAP